MIHPIADCEPPLLCLLGPDIVSQETAISGSFQPMLASVCNGVIVWRLIMGWIPGTGGKFLNRTAMACAVRSRIDKWDLMKLQSFCKAKDTVNKTKRGTSPFRSTRAPGFLASRVLPNTRKGPHGTPHGTLRPLVSGTQRLPQSNRAELETAVHREAGYPGLIWGTNPFHSTRAPGYLAS